VRVVVADELEASFFDVAKLRAPPLARTLDAARTRNEFDRLVLIGDAVPRAAVPLKFSRTGDRHAQ
jgi:hypothetical protein